MTFSITRFCLTVFASMILAGCTHPGDDVFGETPEQRAESKKWTDKRRQAQAPLLDELARMDLENGTVTLYTINPHSYKTDEKHKPIPEPAGVSSFHDWEVLGSVVIADLGEKSKLMTELVRGGRETDGSVASCFLPRHALRIETKDKTVDVVVCFECLSATVFGADAGKGYLTSDTPLVYFSQVAKRHRLPVAQ